MPMGGLLIVVKWLVEASFLRLLWLQVVIRQDRGRIFPEPEPASAYGCHLYLHLSLPRHSSSPGCLCTLSPTPWMSSNISQEGIFPSTGFRLCGGLVGVYLPGRGPRKSASGVPTERWQERRQGVSRPFALETCREPGHSLTRTSRDPRLFWGTVSRQEAGTSEKGICQSEAQQSTWSATEHGRMPGHRHWAGTAT